jgi:hypothetical protein
MQIDATAVASSVTSEAGIGTAAEAGAHTVGAGAGRRERFRLVLIKPSHYDDEGYVIQWLRAAIPSNTLAQLYGLAADCAAQDVLGPEVEIEIEAYDETNRVLPLKRIARQLKRDGGLVGLVGVQSNQFPRAMDIARPLRAAGIQVAIGGFHVSGCMAMLPEPPDDIKEAMDLGISLFAGEAEERLDRVLRDAHARRLEPVYNFMDDLPGLEGATVPFLPEPVVRRTAGAHASFDAGRGCPFQCSFCTIINVQGRKSRYRSPDDCERIVRANLDQGVRRFFITDDNFARNKDWEKILDRLIQLREVEKLKFSMVIQVDTLCHRLPNFVEKCARAGVKRVFIGLENINPDNLAGAKKRQNKIWEYRKMLQAWKAWGVLTYAGYILGFPGDTPESIRRDIEIIKAELPIDLLEFFILTPLPGSEDHKTLWSKGVWMDPDMNKYDLNHVTTGHASMSAAELKAVYDAAWHQYYSPEHAETILKRAAACRMNVGNMMFLMLWFYGCIAVEKLHPLEGGWFRRKIWSQRRSSLPRENPLVFFPRRAWEVVDAHARWLGILWRFGTIRRRLKRDPDIRSYMDLALTPVDEDGELQTALMQTHAEKIGKTYGAPKTKKPAPAAAAE